MRLETLLATLVAGALLTWPETVDDAEPDPELRAQSLRAIIEADRRQFEPEEPASFRAVVGGVEARVDRRGLVATAGPDVVGLATVAVDGAPLDRATPEVGGCAPGDEMVATRCVGTVALHRGALTEWWASRASGLEHGWTLHGGKGVVSIDVAVTPGEVASVDADGRGAVLQGSTGERWRYDGLVAWDADGAPVDARLTRGAEGLLVSVETTGARFPVTVDPQLAWLEATTIVSAAGEFGCSVAGAGDVNGDGYDDILVGAIDPFQSVVGAAYVYYGSAEGIDVDSEVELTPSDGQIRDEFGNDVAAAGDVDGDGYDDVIVGAHGETDRYDRFWKGAAYVYHGSAAGIDLASEVKIVASDRDTQDDFGIAVSGAGDIDGDGYDDVIIGAPGDDGTGDRDGSAYIYYGSPQGIDVATEDKLRASVLWRQAGYGQHVAGAGDLDGDGYDDVVIGAAGDNTNGPHSGAAYVYYGSPAGIVAAEQKILASDGVASQLFGGDVAKAGDVNGDGYDDLLVAAFYDGTLGFESGAVYVYHGSAVGLDPATEVKLLPSDGDIFDHFGYSASGGGDIDGDGYDDIVVGSPFDDEGGESAGSAYVYYGSAAGIDVTTETRLGASNAGPERFYGIGVDLAGDVDGDGTIEVVVGAYKASTVHVHRLCEDLDGDGSCVELDCDDADASRYPGAVEEVGDGIDSDCDGGELCFADADEDGFADAAATVASDDADCSDPGEGGLLDLGDCDDRDAAIFPGAAEGVGDEVDSDCDGGELCLVDADDDGYVVASVVVSGDVDCTDPGEGAASDPSGDCDDGDPAVHPGATEQPGDEIDQDCDGTERCFPDVDGDGHADPAAWIPSEDLDCADPGEFGVLDADDCDDAAADIHPGAPERIGDEVDQDCDGKELCYVDADDDRHNVDRVILSDDVDCTDPAEGLAIDPVDDCDDSDPAVRPGVVEHVGDEVDSDCDGRESCFADADDDGYRLAAVEVASDDVDCADPGEARAGEPAGDCDDQDPNVHPDAREHPGDELDSDCDGREVCLTDGDGDGYSDGVTPTVSSDLRCTDPGEARASDPSGDCDDGDAAIHPGAEDTPGDGVDSDCDGRGGPDDDEDGDGLTWAEEEELGTSDANPDTDGDGVSDLEEVERGRDPLVANRLCGCRTSGPGGASPLMLLFFVAVWRRRPASWSLDRHVL